MKKALFYIIINVTISGVFAQSENIKFRHLTTQDGLSQSWVKCIFRDSYGFMWFATINNGVNKYDGYTFSVYKNNPKKQNTLVNNEVTAIIEDNDSVLWFGTSWGLCKYDRGKDGFIPNPIFHQAYIIGMHKTIDGRLFVITPFDFILFEPATNKADYLYNGGKSLQNEFFTGKAVTLNDSIYLLSTNRGLLRFNINKQSFGPFQVSMSLPELKHANILSLIKDSENNIWLGTNSNGVYCLRLGKNKVINLRYAPGSTNGLSEGPVTKILEDDHKNLWFAIGNKGIDIINLNDLDKGTPKVFNRQNDPNDKYGLSRNTISELYKDRNNIIWIGTHDKGVDYYHDALFKFNSVRRDFTKSEGLSNNTINIIQEEGSTLWVGTDYGLNKYDKSNNKWLLFVNDKKNTKSIAGNGVHTFFRDSKNNFWVGTWGGGLNLLNEEAGTFIRYLHENDNKNSLSSNNVFGIAEDQDGTLWIATMGGGLNEFNPATNKFVRHTYSGDSISLSNDWVKAVLVSSKSEVWAATSHGLNLYNRESKTFKHYLYQPEDMTSISNDRIMSLFEDSRGNFWVGAENGLNRYNREEDNFVFYSEEDGLPNGVIRSIIEDDKGNLWIGTNSGLSMFVDAVNNPQKISFINYDEKDGLPSNEFSSRASFKNKNGELYFGGNNGYTVFHPDSIITNTIAPPIVFTNFFVFNRTVAIDEPKSPLKKHIGQAKEAFLDHKQTVFSIEYAALNYLIPEDNKYAYKLEGFDEDWNYVGKNRLATYTNLDPGKYIFRVKASNNDNVWNEKGISLTIHVLPPWWKTIIFKVLLSIVLLTLVIGFYFYRINTLKKQKIHLERVVHARTSELEELNATKDKFFSIIGHDLKSPFNAIIGFSRLLGKHLTKLDDKKGLSLNEMVHDSSLKVLRLLENLLEWSRSQTGSISFKPKPLVVKKIVNENVNFLKGLLAEKNIKVEIDAPEHLIIYADLNMINTVFRNLISNAIKFSEVDKKIEISASRDGQFVQLTIEDEGIGMSQEDVQHLFKIEHSNSRTGTKGETGTGLGLILCKEYIEKSNGKIWAKSEENKGTAFYFTLPLHNDGTQDLKINE